jgi:tetrahydromethanopterin S-methyltransferase subunit B
MEIKEINEQIRVLEKERDRLLVAGQPGHHPRRAPPGRTGCYVPNAN